MKILFRIFLAVLLSSGIAFAGIDSVSTRRRAESINEKMGSAVINRAITAKLHVSKNGDNTDGSTWGKAYNKIQDALDAASTDINDLTLILIAVATGPTDNYDIDTAGDPTWTGNYEIVGVRYRGMASEEEQKNYSEKRKSGYYVEGISVDLPYTGMTEDVVEDLLCGVRSGLTYTGARNIRDFRKKARFRMATLGGLHEAQTHALNITKG